MIRSTSRSWREALRRTDCSGPDRTLGEERRRPGRAGVRSQRRKAFEWLVKNWKKEGLADRYQGYTVMPLNVDDLSDDEMYRYAITENIQRKGSGPDRSSQGNEAFTPKNSGSHRRRSARYST